MEEISTCPEGSQLYHAMNSTMRPPLNDFCVLSEESFMDTATTEEKFHHAVELIQNLPKSGNFQPSNDMKLKFYSLFKQATIGPCNSPKPGFWDIINKMKWDAWNGLGEMSKEDAMKNYIAEFVKVLKSQPFDENAVKDFVHIMGPYIDFAPMEFQEKYAHQKLNGKIPIHKHRNSNPYQDPNKINGCHANGSAESDGEEFSDTFDQVNEEFSREDYLETPKVHSANVPNVRESRGGGEQGGKIGQSYNTNSPILGASGNDRSSQGSRGENVPSHSRHMDPAGAGDGGRRDNSGVIDSSPAVVNEQLALAVLRLQHTMEQVARRLDSLEILLQDQKAQTCPKVLSLQGPVWSIFGVPLRTAILIFAWPLVCQWLIHILRSKYRKRTKW